MKPFRKTTFPTLQVEQSDCGVACLSSIIIYYNGFENLERLRELSGTTRQGTTLLGLYQAARQCGLSARGMEATAEYLKTIEKPCILHVVINNLQHYVVCYGFKKGVFLIGDPAIGMVQYAEEELESKWKSHTLLELEVDESFRTKEDIARKKKRWFKVLIQTDAPILMLIAVSALIFSLSGIAVSVFLQQLLDKIIPEANVHRLMTGLVLVSLLLLVKGGVNYLRGHLLNLQNRDFNSRLIDHFYSSLLFLPRFFFANRKTGELVARMEDTARIQTVLAFVFGDLIRDILLVIVSIGFIFYYSFQIGIIALLSIPAFALIAFFYHKKIVLRNREVMTANAKKTSNYINTLNGIDTIKTYNKEDEFSQINRNVYGVFQDKLFDLGKVGIKLQVVCDLASILLIMLVLGGSAFLVLSGRLKIGELTAVISISASMLPAIGNIAFANTRLQGARVAFDRMFDFTSIEPEYRSGDASPLPAPIHFKSLHLKDVSFSFPGRKPLLKKINMAIIRNQATMLVGESGEGKTTLLHLLVRFYSFERGAIRLNDSDLQEFPIPRWREIIGVVPQEISIFNGTVLENICLSAEEQEWSKCVQFCIEYGFHQYFNSFPQGYSTMLGEEGINISGGQKQLVALARALYKKPQVLLLDEPTSAMDRNTEQFVINLLVKVKNEAAIFIITHRINLTGFADKVYVLENGVISQAELVPH